VEIRRTIGKEWCMHLLRGTKVATPPVEDMVKDVVNTGGNRGWMFEIEEDFRIDGLINRNDTWLVLKELGKRLSFMCK